MDSLSFTQSIYLPCCDISGLFLCYCWSRIIKSLSAASFLPNFRHSVVNFRNAKYHDSTKPSVLFVCFFCFLCIYRYTYHLWNRKSRKILPMPTKSIFLDDWVSRITMTFRPPPSWNAMFLNSSFTAFVTNIFFLWLSWLPIHLSETHGLWKIVGLIGEAYSSKGVSRTIDKSILSPPWQRSLSEFEFINLKTVAGLALFVSWLFSYLRVVLLSFFPHSPHSGQHIPGDG